MAYACYTWFGWEMSRNSRAGPPHDLHRGRLSAGLLSAALLCLRMAKRAPATACGDSRPVMLPSFLGVGSMLVLRDAARELAGRGAAPMALSMVRGGWNEARRLLVSADMDACDASRGLAGACWA